MSETLDTSENREAKLRWEQARHDLDRNYGAQAGWQLARGASWLFGLVLASGGFISGIALAQFGSAAARRRVLRLGEVGADDLLRADPRRPILYLRSFADDQLKAGGASDGWDFESVVVEALALAGPVVAVGGRTDRSLKLGAARTRPESAWQSKVSEYIGQSLLVVVVVGTTSGLLWELETLLTSGKVGQVVLILPPLKGAQPKVRWSEFVGLAAPLLGTGFDRIDASRTLAVFFDRGRAVVIAGRARSKAAYAEAVRIVAASKLARLSA